MGLIHDIPTCAGLIARIEREADEVLWKLGKAVGAERDLKSRL